MKIIKKRNHKFMFMQKWDSFTFLKLYIIFNWYINIINIQYKIKILFLFEKVQMCFVKKYNLHKKFVFKWSNLKLYIYIIIWGVCVRASVNDCEIARKINQISMPLFFFTSERRHWTCQFMIFVNNFMKH